LKKIVLIVYFFFLAFLVYLSSVLVYATITDYAPQGQLNILNETTPEVLSTDSIYSAMIWNIGYAGLGEESDFFYDGGKHSNMSEAIVTKNFNGVSNLMQRSTDIDFILIQEIDRQSSRSHYVDQVESINEILINHSYGFAYNFKVDFIPQPFLDPVGFVRSGICSYSRYASRKSYTLYYPSEYEWPRRCFMLDRCILVQRFDLDNGKELLIINNHNSAFDGGKLKDEEMKFLKSYLLDEYSKGNYIIVGGDWNQCPPDFNPDKFRKVKGDHYFPYNIKPDFMAQGWEWIYDENVPTNRKVTEAYKRDETFTTIIDFYLVSPNINIETVQGVDLDFKYADHQPVYIEFGFEN
jgi:endonuclease/exonuclease/phosphatase family metal-dependent hydrolase